MKKTISIAAIAGCLVLGACASERAQTPQAQAGTEFTRALAQEYYAYADQQRLQAWDYGASNYFRRKADRVAQGEALPPETPGQGWRPRFGTEGDLRAARERLMSALQANATVRAPAAAARAQARYDCWLEHTDDPLLAERGPWLQQKLQECRSEFLAAMNEVEAAMRPAPAAAPAPAPAVPPREQSFLVFFDFDRAVVTPQGAEVVRRAVDTWRRGGNPRITVTGHADRAGPEAYNQVLSQRRAQAVQEILIREGVPANQITTFARGETQPLVPTPDGVPEPQNRRVEIVLQ